MSIVENPHAGQGRAIPLDIGDDIGALVIDMPAELEGVEVEIRRAVASDVGRVAVLASDGGRVGVVGDVGVVGHVAVVARPAPNGRAMYSAVFAGLSEGAYELYRRPDGPIRLRVDVAGGEVTRARWPG